VTAARGAGRIAAGALALALAAALAACTGTAQPVPTASSTRPPAFTGVRHPIPTGSALANDPELYGRVVLTDCAATSDGWKATGTMKNPGAAKTTASILVIFTDAQARMIDSATTTVEVKAGAKASWAAARKFSAPAGTRCVVRAVRSG
jgi:hypothetical protein